MEIELEGRRVVGTYKFRDLRNWNEPDHLAEILQLNPKSLSDRESKILAFLESSEQYENTQRDWLDFKWKLTAFYEIQDVFDSPIYFDSNALLNLFHIWYFYFESRHILCESILCGIRGFYSAGNALLRLFLEFSILQLYFYRLCEQKRSYQPLEEFFNRGHSTSWNTLLNNALPNDKFSRPIKLLLDIHMKGLSKSAAHPYLPDFSPRRHSNSPSELSLEGLYSWQHARILIRPVLWAYFVNFPMLFHPVDIVKKFGVNPPVGIFVDEQSAGTIKKCLEAEEYADFARYSNQCSNVSETMQWYQDRDDLSEADIQAQVASSVVNVTNPTVQMAYVKMKAEIRGIREIMALKEVELPDDDVDVEAFYSLTYTKWKRLYKFASNKSEVRNG